MNELYYFNNIMNNTILLNTQILWKYLYKSLEIQIIGSSRWSRKKAQKL